MGSGDELIELEQQGWRALATAGQAPEFYREWLDADPVMQLPGGMRLTGREQIIESMSGPPWSSYELDGESALMLNDDVGIVTYGVTAVRAGNPEYSALVCSVYVQRPSGWRLAFHQQTPR